MSELRLNISKASNPLLPPLNRALMMRDLFFVSATVWDSMLHTFRNAAKTWVVKLLFALLALSFVAWGVGDFVRRSAMGTGPAISVGGVDVSASEVEMEFKREVERQQEQFKGHLTEELARKIGYLDKTIQTITTRLLVDNAARKLGLAVSDAAVLQAVTNDPNLKNEQGVVDRERLRAALTRMGMTEAGFLKVARAEQQRNQLAQAMTGGVIAPMTLVDPLVRRRYEERVAELALVSDNAVPAPAAPAQAELEAYYNANTAKFMAPEYRALTVLTLRPSDVAGDIQITDDDLAKAFDQRQAEFNTPEKRQASQILLADQDKADKAVELIKQGRDLSAIAKSLDVKVIELGTLAKNELPPELQDAVFNTASGVTTGPVRSDLGWHVIKVYQIVPAQNKTLDQVKTALTEILRRDKTADLLAELSNKVEDALGGGASIEEAARRFSLPVASFDALDSKGLAPNGKPVDSLPKDPSFLSIAFHTDQGAESQMAENGQDGYFLIRVDGVTAPAPHPLAQVKDQAAAGWIAAQRHQLAKDKAETLAAQLKGAPIGSVDKIPGVEVKTSQPFSRNAGEASGVPDSVIGKTFEASEGEIFTSEIADGWAVARLAQIKPVNPADHPDKIQAVRRMMSQAIAGDFADSFLAAEEAKIGVKIDRSQLTREE